VGLKRFVDELDVPPVRRPGGLFEPSFKELAMDIERVDALFVLT